MNKKLSMLGLCLTAALSNQGVAVANAVSQYDDWQQLLSKAESSHLTGPATKGQQLSADIASLSQVLLSAQEPIVITLPLPDGKFADFVLSPSPIMATDLQEKYPNIRTFDGHQLDNPDNRGRFDITPQGFHALFRYGEETVFIDPQHQQDDGRYLSYFRKDAIPQGVPGKRLPPKQLLNTAHQPKSALSRTDSLHAAVNTQLKTYRIAISATGEYTQFHGGTKEKGLAAVVTMLNRVNDVYQTDLAVRLELVANNDALIFVDPQTDPFKNADSDGEINTGIIDKAIGNTSYDVGHVVNTAGGGLASLGVVCDASAKGDGVTGSDNPTGDAFNIDYVAHELGHQFGAEHTFNGLTEACNGNRSDTSAYEPGSGSTVMSYAGICGEQNLQEHSQAYFHSHSIDQIQQHIAQGTCYTSTPLSNSVPQVEAGANYSIPARTPFELTGSATDADGDTLSYDWQQYDLGPASTNKSQQTDDGKRPLFRVWLPSDSPKRTLPRLEDILKDTLSPGETYPTTTRELNFRLIVRDTKFGLARDAMKVNVIDTGEAFAITQPTTGTQWTGSNANVSWNVAKTDQAPIACSKVNIHLSADGGKQFNIPLATGVDNDGSQDVNLPTLETTKARIRLACADNIFFAINKGEFSVSASGQEPQLTITGLKAPLTLAEDTRLTLTPDMFNFQGQAATGLRLEAGQHYQVEGTTLIPELNYHGELSVKVIGERDGISSPTFQAAVTVTSVNDAPVAVNDTASVNQNSTNNLINLLANDTDVDTNDSLSIVSVDYKGAGTVSLTANGISYTPANGFSGTETFTYSIKDKAGAQASASVTISVKADSSGTDSGQGEAGGTSSGGSMGYWLTLLMALAAGRRTVRPA